MTLSFNIIRVKKLSGKRKKVNVLNGHPLLTFPIFLVINRFIVDICFDKANEIGPCALSTCYTGGNGTLKVPFFLKLYLIS